MACRWFADGVVAAQALDFGRVADGRAWEVAVSWGFASVGSASPDRVSGISGDLALAAEFVCQLRAVGLIAGQGLVVFVNRAFA